MVNNSAIVSLNHDLGSSGQKSDLESPSPPPPPISPVRDVTPPPLPDLQLAIEFVINGKTLEDTKEQTVKIEQVFCTIYNCFVILDCHVAFGGALKASILFGSMLGLVLCK